MVKEHWNVDTEKSIFLFSFRYKIVSRFELYFLLIYFLICTDLGSMAFGRLWLQIGMSGWLTGDYSLRCQPVDYSDRPQVLRVGLTRLPLINATLAIWFSSIYLLEVLFRCGRNNNTYPHLLSTLFFITSHIFVR